MTTKTFLMAGAVAAALGLSALSLAAQALASGETPEPPRLRWSFSGPFGTFDRAQLQRGFKVYREVCSACHPFYTGKQKILDTGGRVARFEKRYAKQQPTKKK